MDILSIKNELGQWERIPAIKGDDYVITQNDYDEIADVVMENFVPLTQAQYDNLPSIDPDKFYYIIES